MGHRACRKEKEKTMIWTILHWVMVIVAVYLTYRAIDYLAND